MTTHVVRLPDVGEGVAEAELVSWQVAVGDVVHPDSVLAEVLTDKATVEIYAPVAGRVTSVHGTVGDVLAIGSDLVHIDTDTTADVASATIAATPHTAAAATIAAPTPAPPGADATVAEPELAPDGALSDEVEHAVASSGEVSDARTSGGYSSTRTDPAVAASREVSDARTSGGYSSTRTEPAATGVSPGARRVDVPPVAAGTTSAGRPIAAPAVRQRARDLGIDLRTVRGTAPAGRITHTDLDAFIAGNVAPLTPPAATLTTRASADIPVVGLRRRIAERMTTSASRIPHITYVDEIDVGQVEELRRTLNATYPDHARLTLLPFLMRAIVLATGDQPHINATFDDEAGVLHASGPVHIGIATQTPNGLLVPVVRDAEARDLWQSAAEVARVSEAARTSKATRDELSGSTITITSLGALGGLVTTPIINHPEVAIVGVNKMQVRPVWDGNGFQPRTMMNLSSSFDHRVVDGWDAATFVQRIKALLETPTLLFIGAPNARAGDTA